MAKKQLDIAGMEKRWLEYWKKEGVYKFNRKTKKEIYSIDTPPPTVSGDMHMGHAFHYAQGDFIARYKRMRGFEVFYPFGTDDNGLPTERLVEKLKGVRSKDMSRAEFIDLCLKTLKEIRPEFIQRWKNLGVSCDYDVYYSTIDDNSRKLSQKYFIDLYNKKLVYRDNFPTIFCPECQTPIAQAELEDKSKKTLFSTLKFTSGGKELAIATTRPELLGACVAVFVNPDDKRYKKLIGKKAKVPLYGHEVPIFGDKTADMAINRLKLAPRVVFNSDGTLKDERYEGMKIKAARRAILEDLEKEGLIIDKAI